MNPNLIVKTSEPEPQRRVLTVRERESLQSTAGIYGFGQSSDQWVPGSQGFGPVVPAHLNVNRVRLNEQQKRVLQVLKDGTPEPTNGDQRDVMSKRAEQLKEQFQPYLQTREEVRVIRRDNPAYFSALDKHKMWTTPQEALKGRTPEQVAEEYRNIKRRLEPEDEFADSLDRLRRPK